jgi:Kef-type K+ transport system membrane component KefB
MSFTLPTLNYHSVEFDVLAEIGILFLLFLSGLETNFSKLKKMGKASTYIAVGGVIVPLILGFISGYIFGFSIIESLIIGLILTATSIGVTVRSLMDINALDSDVGVTILGGAVIDDIIAILLLAFTFALTFGTLTDALWVGIKIGLFFLIFLYLGLLVIDKILNLGEKIHLPKAFLSISLAILLIYSFFADKAGISGIVGAFVAGLLIGQNVRSVKILDDVKALGYGFFMPLFFVWIGSSLWLNVNTEISTVTTIIIFAVVIITVSIIGKIIGCGIGAKLAGLTNIQSLQVGVGMIPRMELALIIATVSIKNKIVIGETAHQFLVVTVLLTIVTTFIAPFLIKATFKNR